jgi:hypothetical protein
MSRPDARPIRATAAITVAALTIVPIGWYLFERGAEDDQPRLTVALLTGVYLTFVLVAVVGMRRRPIPCRFVSWLQPPR